MKFQWLPPKKVLRFSLLLSLFPVFLLFHSFEIQSDLRSLLPQNHTSAERFADILSAFGSQDYLFLLIEGESANALIAFAEDLAPRLQALSWIEKIIYKITPEELEFSQKIFTEFLFYYATPEQLKTFIARLQPQALEKHFRYNQAKLYSADPSQVLRIQIDPLGFLESFYQEKAQQSPFDLSTGYWLSPQPTHTALLMKIKGKFPSTDLHQSLALMEGVQHALTLTQTQQSLASPSETPCTVSLLGGYAVAQQKYREFRKDLSLTLSTSLLMVFALLWWSFRYFRFVLFMAIPLHLALLWALAFGSYWIGPLTSIATAFAAILVGIGVDFAIHFLHRFAVEREHSPPEEALKTTLTQTGRGLILAGLTTIAGFSAFYTTDFKGFAELGLLSALGICFCLLFTFVLLPLFLLHYLPPHLKISPRRLGSWSYWGIRFPRTLLFFALVLTLASVGILGFLGKPGIPFQSNIHILRPQEQETLQKKLAFYFKQSEVLYLSYHAKTEEELHHKTASVAKVLESLHQQGVLHHFQCLSQWLPPFSQQETYQKLLKQVPLENTLHQLKNHLESYGFHTHRSSTEEFPFSPEKESFFSYLHWLKRALEPKEKLTLDKIPQGLQENFVHHDKNGYHALAYLYPREALETQEKRQHFLNLVLPQLPPSLELTGLAVLLYHLESLIFSSFIHAIQWAFILIFLITFLQFRSRFVFLVLLPLLLGVLWMLATLKILNIPLNFMNIVVFPMILGLGIDDGLHFILKYLETLDLEKTLQDTGLPIVLTSVTTFLGFGSLLFAENLGLVSIGALATLGVFYCLLISLWVLPAFLKLFPFTKTQK